MLNVDPMKRVTGSDALKHPWIMKYSKVRSDEVQAKLNPHIISSLRQFRSVTGLKRAALNMLVKMISTTEIELLRQEFFKIDKDRTGLITVEEL